MNPLVITYAKIGAALVLPVALLIWRGVVRVKQAGFGRAIAWWFGALMGLGFGAAFPFAIPEDTKRWAPFRIGREVLRFSTLAAGVVFLLFVLAALLPMILDALVQGPLDALPSRLFTRIQGDLYWVLDRAAAP